MGSTRHSSTWLGAPLALLLGALLSGSVAHARDEAPRIADADITRCGDKQVGAGEGMLRPLGHGFFAEGDRVRRGCTLLLQRPLKNRPPVTFAPDSFHPLGCGFFRYANSIYWGQPLGEEEPVDEPGGQRAEVLTRVDLADARTFELDAECRPRDARFFYLNHTARPELPAFVAVPRGEAPGFEELGCGFVRYEGRVFFGSRVVEGVHVPSFASVLGRLSYQECGAGMYGRDRSRVWWRSQVIRGAKARTFRVPRDENPEFRIACDGRRSFQLASLEKRPHPLCRAKKRVKGKARK